MKEKITKILKQYYGEDAEFREGQYEAIESTYKNPKTLVVQKTGWGKSLVYFISTKLFREENKGFTLVISPLLVLMENQKKAALKLNIKCAALNSIVSKEERSIIIKNMVNQYYDLVFVTPETLFKEDIQIALPNMKIGLFVVDEAHCISDWGHDFRLNYGKINKIIQKFPNNIHVLGTTATANNRVIDDLKTQFGDDVYISKGSLTRDSLYINVIKVKNVAERYTWILKNINKLPGTGIIYCLTQRDCDYLTKFLTDNGISAESYYSKSQEEDENMKKIQKFLNNEIKVIVATIKLGMGFDKGDIGFVIHYQMPSNIVSYYQQIGRAGRNIDKAYTILMSGPEDLDIINYFINTAFPTKEECVKVIDSLEKYNGLSLNYLSGCLNMKLGRLSKTVMFLENEGFIYKEKTKYYVSGIKFIYDNEHYEKVTNTRISERNQMVGLLKTKECLNKYIVNCLDDNVKQNCNRCSNCIKQSIFDNDFTDEEINKTLSFINELEQPIEPRKKWPSKDFFGTTIIKNQLIEGICLSKYNDVGYGKLVKDGKYKDHKFDDELVGKSSGVLKKIIKKYEIKYITNVPSLRSNIVEDFTKRLAKSLKIEYIDTLLKTNETQQKDMNNSYYQCKNAINSFRCKEKNYSGNIILVDDMIDSKWTITVCGYYLMEAGFNSVFPYALADTSHRDDDDE